jgi:hypothetical protein
MMIMMTNMMTLIPSWNLKTSSNDCMVSCSMGPGDFDTPMIVWLTVPWTDGFWYLRAPVNDPLMTVCCIPYDCVKRNISGYQRYMKGMIQVYQINKYINIYIYSQGIFMFCHMVY